MTAVLRVSLRDAKGRIWQTMVVANKVKGPEGQDRSLTRELVLDLDLKVTSVELVIP